MSNACSMALLDGPRAASARATWLTFFNERHFRYSDTWKYRLYLSGSQELGCRLLPIHVQAAMLGVTAPHATFSFGAGCLPRYSIRFDVLSNRLRNCLIAFVIV